MNAIPFKQTLLGIIIGGICAITPAHTYGDLIIPKRLSDDYAVYVYGFGNDRVHLFGSDGQYCYKNFKNHHDFVSVGGQWVQHGNRIDITYDTPKRTFFGLWHNWGYDIAFHIDLETLIEKGFGDKPFLLGFGQDVPTKLARFDKKIHATFQPISKGTKTVFIGEAEKQQDGYVLTAFSLENYEKIQAKKAGHGYFLSLASTPNGLTDDQIAKLPKSFKIYHLGADEVLFIDDAPAWGFVSNDTNTDVIMIGNLLNECQGESPLRSLKSYFETLSQTPQEKAILPLLVPNSRIITYQGAIDNGAWLKQASQDE